MPNPTTKSRQELRSRFVRNAIPTEADFADLIAASLNLADDGLRKLPNEPLSLVRQKADQPLLRFFADPTAEGSVWQMSLSSGMKGEEALGFTNQKGMSVLHLEATGNVGIGTTLSEHRLTVEATHSHPSQASNSRLMSRGALAIKSNAPQLDFIDTSNGVDDRDWAIHANDGKLYFIVSPWDHQSLVIDAKSGTAKVGVGTSAPESKLHLFEAAGTLASATKGSFLIDHADSGGASSIVFRSKAARNSDFAYMEYRDQNPNLSNTEAGLLTIGIQNDADDHIALMPSGNVGIGTTLPEHRLIVDATNAPTAKASYSRLTGKGALAIKGNAPQLDFIDTSNGGSDRDWAIHANDGRLWFIHSPWEYSNLVIDASSETAKVGIGTHSPKGKLHLLEAKGTLASAKEGTLVIEHADSGGFSSIVFQSTVARVTDFAYMEYRDKSPNSTEAGLLTIGIENDADDHIALMPSGNVGINTTTPGYRLHVNGTAGVSGQVDLVTGSNPIRFSGTYSGFPDNALNTAEICNDTAGEKRLIIAGNKSAGGSTSSRRIVGIYDDLIVNGVVVRKVWAASGYSIDETNEGQISDRILKVTKLLGTASALRITYYDNFRVKNAMAAASWEIRINGKPCNPGIHLNRYESSTNNLHIAGTLVGYAQNLNAGTYEIQVWVNTIPGTNAGDAYTGWGGQLWTLEAEEVRLNS